MLPKDSSKLARTTSCGHVTYARLWMPSPNVVKCRNSHVVLTVRKYAKRLQPQYPSLRQFGRSWWAVGYLRTMFGGIPNNELDRFANWWDIFPSLRNELFSPVNGAYSKLIPSPDRIFDTIRRNPEVSEYQLRYLEAVNPLRDALIDIVVNPLSSPERLRRLNPAIEFNSFSAHLFEVIKPFSLIDSYRGLSDSWRQLAKNNIRPWNIAVRGHRSCQCRRWEYHHQKKDGKDVEVQDGWVGRILPFELVQRELLGSEAWQTCQTSRRSAMQLSGRIAEILESLPEAEGVT